MSVRWEPDRIFAYHTWSAKAQELLRQQYAAVGAAAKASLTETVASLEHLASKNGDVLPLIEKYKQRLEATKLYIDSYRRYCWPVQSVSDLKLAPFHLLATEGQVHTQRDHVWHMEKLAEVCKASDGLLLATSYRQVDVTDAVSVEEATQWWQELTGRGGEGMVVKPLDFIVRGRRGLTQPAVKCRGPVNTCELSMGLNTCFPRTWSVCAVVRFPPSVPWHSVNSLSASKHWSDSSGRSRFVAYMNASSVFLPSKASRSIHVCSLANKTKTPYRFVREFLPKG
jgi:PNKP adenylyltransferase domain, ligase domain